MLDETFVCPSIFSFSRVFSVHIELKFFLDTLRNFREQYLLLLEAGGQHTEESFLYIYVKW